MAAAWDTYASASSNGGSTTLTLPAEGGLSGSNHVAVVFISAGNNLGSPTITSVTRQAEAYTPKYANNSAYNPDGYTSTHSYFKVAPTAASGSTAIVHSSSSDEILGVICHVNGASQDADPFTGTNYLNSSTTTPSVSCSSTTTDYVVGCEHAYRNPTAGGSQTEIVEESTSNPWYGNACRRAGAATSVSMNWTNGAGSWNEQCCHILSIAQYSAGGHATSLVDAVPLATKVGGSLVQ